MAMVIMFVSLLTVINLLPLCNALELSDNYITWAEGRVVGRPCGHGVQCDLRHQYCDAVMETCRPCTELCRTWDAPEDMDICNRHCAVFLGYHVGVRESSKASHHHKANKNSDATETKSQNDLQTTSCLCDQTSTLSTVSSVHILIAIVVFTVVLVVGVSTIVYVLMKQKQFNSRMGEMEKRETGVEQLLNSHCHHATETSQTKVRVEPSAISSEQGHGQRPRSSHSPTLTSVTSQPPPYVTNDSIEHDNDRDVRSYNRDYSASIVSSSANGSESPGTQPLLSNPRERV